MYVNSVYITKLALQLYKAYNDAKMGETWMRLNFQQMFNMRNDAVMIADVSRMKVGRNILVNRLNTLNGKIKYNWLNLTYDSFKIQCKQLLLI